MESFSSDTPLSSSQPPPNRPWLPAFRPALSSRASPSRSWHTVRDSFDPPFIATHPEPDYHHIDFSRNYGPQGAPPQLLYPDSLKVYPSPPSSSTPKPNIPLPEVEEAEFAPSYSTHLAGVLDSPPVMRREDLVSQKPLTPPPTMPQTTLSLPDPDVDSPLFEQDSEEVEEVEEEYDTDESYPCPSETSPPQSSQPDSPLSPLSPSWDPSCPQKLSMACTQDYPEFEQLDTLLFPCGPCVPPALDYCHPSPISPHVPSSLLGFDDDTSSHLLPPIYTSWDPTQHSDSDSDSPSSSTSSSSLTSLTDDELPTPSSPLISRLDLPDLEDDALPKIVPSSPSRRSCSGLPDSDMEMGDLASDPVLALPGQQLLSFPGVDADDDLIPRITTPGSIPLTSIQPLLFIDDPRDVPLPRSPSPEDFDLCLSPEEITDPELAKLFDLRKRSIAAERAARRLEALTDDVDLFTRAEARKIRKRERERSKEVGALLRLKLGDSVATSPQERSPECDAQKSPRRRGTIGDMSQLVAQMVFRRNETSRALVKRKSLNTAREYVRSALSDAVSASEDE